jgi:integrase
LRKLALKADLPHDNGFPVSPHVLRATGMSIAVAEGMSPHVAQQQLGHANLRTTMEYLRLPMHGALHQISAVFE